MKKFWTTAIIIVLLAAGAFGGWKLLRPSNVAAEDPTVDVPTGVIGTGTIEQVVGATGHVASVRDATLVMTIGGQVQQLTVDKGDRIVAGQVLLHLDDSKLRDQADRAQASYHSALKRLAQSKMPASAGQIAAAEASIAVAEANLAKMKAGPTAEDIRQAQLSVDSAKNQLWSAQGQRDATKGRRGVTDAAIDSAEASVLIAEVAVQQAELAASRIYLPPSRYDLAAMSAQIDQARAQLQQLLDQPRPENVAVSEASAAEAELAFAQAEQSLKDATLEAPFAGTILSVNATEGEWIGPNAPVITMADMDHLKLEVLLDEVDVALVAEGQDVRLYFDALPDEVVLGSVVQVAPSATQTSGGVAYMVTVAFEPGELPIRLGMTAKVDIVVQRVEDAVLVPNRAVEADREANRYYVVSKTLLGSERTEIKIGLRDDNFTQVTEGLEPGDTVLLQVIDLGASERGFVPPFAPGGAMSR